MPKTLKTLARRVLPKSMHKGLLASTPVRSAGPQLPKVGDELLLNVSIRPQLKIIMTTLNKPQRDVPLTLSEIIEIKKQVRHIARKDPALLPAVKADIERIWKDAGYTKRINSLVRMPWYQKAFLGTRRVFSKLGRFATRKIRTVKHFVNLQNQSRWQRAKSNWQQAKTMAQKEIPTLSTMAKTTSPFVYVNPAYRTPTPEEVAPALPGSMELSPLVSGEEGKLTFPRQGAEITARDLQKIQTLMTKSAARQRAVEARVTAAKTAKAKLDKRFARSQKSQRRKERYRNRALYPTPPEGNVADLIERYERYPQTSVPISNKTMQELGFKQIPGLVRKAATAWNAARDQALGL